MEETTKKYTNGEVTIVWKPSVCIHSRICWSAATGLPAVFNPAVRPWVNPEAAPTERIIEQVKKCPSGALSYFLNSETGAVAGDVESKSLIEVTPNGPLLVHGNIVVKNREGSEAQKSQVTAFCRCGQSGNKPYCDGSHQRAGFEG